MDSECKNNTPHKVPRGLFKYLILSYLEKKSYSGVKLLTEINRVTNGSWSPGPGPIYPILHKLLNKKYIKKDSDNGEKTYSITEDGKNYLNTGRKMIKEYLKKSPFVNIMGEILGKRDMIFFLNTQITSILSYFSNNVDRTNNKKESFTGEDLIKIRKVIDDAMVRIERIIDQKGDSA